MDHTSSRLDHGHQRFIDTAPPPPGLPTAADFQAAVCTDRSSTLSPLALRKQYAHVVAEHPHEAVLLPYGTVVGRRHRETVVLRAGDRLKDTARPGPI